MLHQFRTMPSNWSHSFVYQLYEGASYDIDLSRVLYTVVYQLFNIMAATQHRNPVGFLVRISSHKLYLILSGWRERLSAGPAIFCNSATSLVLRPYWKILVTMNLHHHITSHHVYLYPHTGSYFFLLKCRKSRKSKSDVSLSGLFFLVPLRLQPLHFWFLHL